MVLEVCVELWREEAIVKTTNKGLTNGKHLYFLISK